MDLVTVFVETGGHKSCLTALIQDLNMTIFAEYDHIHQGQRNTVNCHAAEAGEKINCSQLSVVHFHERGKSDQVADLKNSIFLTMKSSLSAVYT